MALTQLYHDTYYGNTLEALTIGPVYNTDGAKVEFTSATVQICDSNGDALSTFASAVTASVSTATVPSWNPVYGSSAGQIDTVDIGDAADLIVKWHLVAVSGAGSYRIQVGWRVIGW